MLLYVYLLNHMKNHVILHMCKSKVSNIMCAYVDSYGKINIDHVNITLPQVSFLELWLPQQESAFLWRGKNPYQVLN